ncbi:extracellular catalytic domain type 1 short-chain-length polyhydroxyalkanoate depolymerase [Nocardia alba]|uniref:extracellular catalytic domain type 1 short-chain-length polyhydroxyalkanoate depolymerase n=1 Tax=Nocardia alba TaxID=225051 RepID=UPI00082D0621|nr:PHB depolymerase family esterase [Nocardia alba]
MTLLRALSVVVGLLFVASCGPSAAASESSVRTIDVGGVSRTFRLYVPENLSGPAPLVVVLHGGFGSGAQAERAYGWDDEADAGGFVVAYPDGLNRAWNTGGGCCGVPERTNVDDIGFLSQVVAAVEHEVPIDARRRYVTGMSNGAVMAYTLACRTSLFAGIGPVAGTQLGECSSPQPLSVIHHHGTADANITYDGTPGRGVARIDGPSVPDLNATWRSIDGCAPPVVTSVGAATTSVAECPGGRSVELVTIAGGGHAWPPGATHTIWQFFAAHPR